MNKYPVVFACDENYVIPFAVATESLLANAAHNTYYDIYCLTPNLFSNPVLDKLDSIKQKYNNCNITYLNLDNEFAGIKTKIPHISYVTYYRFKIPKLLPQYEKALYLDVDTIIRKDLSELFPST